MKSNTPAAENIHSNLYPTYEVDSGTKSNDKEILDSGIINRNSSTPSVSPSINSTSSSTYSSSVSALNATVSATSSTSVSTSSSSTSSLSPTATPSTSTTNSLRASGTSTATSTLTQTPTVTPSYTPTMTVTPTANATTSTTNTVTQSNSPTQTGTPSSTITASITESSTSTSSLSMTATSSNTASVSPSNTPSTTSTSSISSSPSSTPTSTPSVTSTQSGTPSMTPTPTQTPTPTIIANVSSILVNPQSTCNVTECGYSACPCSSILSSLESIDFRWTQTVFIELVPGVYSGPGNTNIVFPSNIQANIIMRPFYGSGLPKISDPLNEYERIIVKCDNSSENGFTINSPKGSFKFEGFSFVTCGSGRTTRNKALIVQGGSKVQGESLYSQGRVSISENSKFNCTQCLFDQNTNYSSFSSSLSTHGGANNNNNNNKNVFEKLVDSNDFDESFFLVSGSEIVITNTTFQNITTRSYSPSHVISCVDIRQSIASFTNCEFKENILESISEYASSCIYASGTMDNQISQSINIHLDQCRFESNSGSAVMIVEDQNIMMNNVLFQQHLQGSMFISYGGNGKIIQSQFINNTNFLSTSFVILPSRTILNSFPNYDMIQCLFENNVNLKSYGGAIYFEYGNLFLFNSTFNNNQGRKGGVLYTGPKLFDVNSVYYDDDHEHDYDDYNAQKLLLGLKDENRSLIIDRCSFDSNSASRSGGCIQIDGSVDTFKITNSNFTNNSASTGRGGVLSLYIPESIQESEIQGNQFKNNMAESAGCIHFSGNCKISKNVFESNNAEIAGVLNIDSGNITLMENEFLYNYAKSSGGALFVYESAIGLSYNNSYFHNKAIVRGGGAYVGGESKFTFFNDKFINNTADSVGGAITINNNSTSEFYFTEISGSITTGSGAINCMGESSPYFMNCSIINNFASQEGAGIYIQDESSPTFENCEISYNNCSTAAGGIVSSENAKGSFLRCTISNNVANSNGGGIKLSGNSSTSFHNCTITNNTASGDGGGISIEDQSSASFFNGDILYNNATSAGGGIAVHGSTTATFTGSNIQFNYALSGGGISLQDNSNALFDSCYISDNRSPVNGGGILAMDITSSRLKNCIISNNYAFSNGAGMQISSFARPKIQNCTISYNYALSTGGGVQLVNFCSPEFTDSFIISNNASSGAGISQSNFVFPSFDNCVIQSNFANSQAGGILLQDNTNGVYSNCLINENNANGGSGGALLTLGKLIINYIILFYLQRFVVVI